MKLKLCLLMLALLPLLEACACGNSYRCGLN